MKTLSKLINEKLEFKGATLYDYFIGALCEEYLAWYFYTIFGNFLVGKERPSIEKFFKETAEDELEDHAEWLLKRMDELDMSCEDIHDFSKLNDFVFHPYNPPTSKNGKLDTKDAILKAISMEKEAIETYKAFEIFTRDNDPVTNKKVKNILADEEEHLAELTNFLEDIENK
jgi:ferritin-like protein